MRAPICVLATLLLATVVPAQNKFKTTESRRPYVHQIPLYDAAERKIDPNADGAAPYSPQQTCKKCHDVESIAHGWHFNGGVSPANGRRGEPWLLTDARTGSVIPLSYRQWEGTYRPDALGMDASAFLKEFGRHLPGHGAGVTGADTSAGRFRFTGAFDIDCMLCHSADRRYSPERWAKEIAKENFAWAPGAALGLLKTSGTAKSLKDDFDPAVEGAAKRLPKTTYDKSRFAPDGTVFFDVVRQPPDTACYTCHSVNQSDPAAPPRWQHDGDVHLRAGLSCTDCHRNGLEHHTVRGFEGEAHPSGKVTSLTCRGCHTDETDGHGEILTYGGRLGAPKATHKGLPPVHLEKMACTACHSGPFPGERPLSVQTSMAHGLGIPSQTRSDGDLPVIEQPVFLPGHDGKLAAHRVVWPSFFGYEVDGKVTPIHPVEAYKSVRRTLRIRKNLRVEMAKVKLTSQERAALLGEERKGLKDPELSREERAKINEARSQKVASAFGPKLAKTLAAMKKVRTEATPLFISGGRAFKLSEDTTTVVSEPHEAAASYAWPLAHDVRPARQSLGAKGCTECHASGAPLFYGTVTANGPAPDTAPRAVAMHQLMEQDPSLMAQWERGFEGREAFKWTALVAVGTLSLVVLLWVFLGLDGLGRRLMGRKPTDGEAA